MNSWASYSGAKFLRINNTLINIFEVAAIRTSGENDVEVIFAHNEKTSLFLFGTTIDDVQEMFAKAVSHTP